MARFTIKYVSSEFPHGTLEESGTAAGGHGCHARHAQAKVRRIPVKIPQPRLILPSFRLHHLG